MNRPSVENFIDHRTTRLALFLLFLILAIRGPVSYSFSDSYGSIQTGQSLLVAGDLTLDEFPGYLEGAGFRVFQKDGHSYYFFPPGSSLMAAPVIWLGSAMGLDPGSPQGDRVFQLTLAALFFSGSGLILLRLARWYLPPLAALATALAFTLGTGMASSLATAYWSQTPAFFLVLLGLMMVLCYPDRPGRWFLLPGLVLGFAVWCRPTAGLALLVVFLIPPQAGKGRLFFLIGAGLAMAGFFLFTYLQLGQWIHPYYLPTNLGNVTPGQFAQALLGNLFSPSRGLFITSAFLVPIVMWTVVRWRNFESRRIILVGLIWTALLVLWVSRFQHWWGGYCFGNRLLIDALPPLFLVSLVAVGDILSISGRRGKTALLLVLSCTGVFSIWVNLGQGLFNPNTYTWCHVQEIDSYPDHLWNWSQAQWLADQDMIAAMAWRNLGTGQKLVSRGEPISADTPGVVFQDLHRLEHDPSDRPFRWTEGDRSLVIWRQDLSLAGGEPAQISLTLGAYREQGLKVLLNGHVLGELVLSGFPPVRHEFPLPNPLPPPPRGFAADCLILELRPDSPVAGVAYQRHIGVSFWEAVVR